jgi:hypothetical protein
MDVTDDGNEYSGLERDEEFRYRLGDNQQKQTNSMV